MANVTLDIPRPSAEQLAKWANITAAIAHEAMGRRGAVHSSIKPIGAGMRVVGPAVTCVCAPGDNLSLHVAMRVAQPGDVLVCDAGGYTEQGLFGDVMATSAQVKGIAGLVVHGGVRDVATIRKMEFPVFSSSICMRGTVKETLGPINGPIVLGGIRVNPGDLVIADDDGVCIVPLEEIDAVYENALVLEKKEEGFRANFTPTNTTWELGRWGELLAKKGIVLDL